MALSPGTKLGPYEIVTPLGAGGMGEVYRARDTRLDRIVAVKILRSHLTNDPEARQRFEREARAISALNHPNICTLFDVGHQDGIDFLVMEFVEGETLGDRLLKGPLPAEKLLKYSQEICAGLEKAHRSGVVHRDLKPSNIMLTKTGVKLMDFGLAKSTSSPAPSASGVTVSLNAVGDQPLTAEGTLVGTFQYMAPEQVEGKDADARSDIFALGAVLYEMATGKPAFAGKTTASVIAAVMASEPEPISAVQPLSPPALDRIIKTCLSKDPDQRFQNIHDVSLQLSWIAEGGSQAGVPARVSVQRKNREHVAWALAAVGLLLALALALIHFRESPSEARAVRAIIQPPEGGTIVSLGNLGSPMLSPDGRNVVFIASVGGVSQLWVRALDSFTPRPLAGTERAWGSFWSPDGRNIAFFAEGKLKRVAATGGSVVTICDVVSGRGGSWNRQDVIIFAKFPGEVFRVPASGGDPQPVTQLDSTRNHKTHRWPIFLPDGNHFLYMASSSGMASDENVIKVGSLDGKTDRILLNASSPVTYDSGYLLFMLKDKLIARRFDPDKLQFLGDPATVAEDVLYEPMYSNGVFSTSGTGVLLYQGGNASDERKIVILDDVGKVLGTLGDPGRFLDLRISPEGNRVAYALADRNTRKPDIWVHDVASGNPTRITRDPRGSRAPLWSHDGSRIAYTSVGIAAKPTTYSMPATGMGEETELFSSQSVGLWYLTDWTPDSSAFVGEDHTESGKVRISLGLINGKDQTVPVLETAGANLYASRLTADGHWIAYLSDETGGREIYVSKFPVPAGRLQVSAKGGRFPLWRADGKELYYLDPENNVIAVDLNITHDSLEVTRRTTLFQLRGIGPEFSWDVFPDGKRFLVTMPKNDVPVPLSLVLNWTADLKK